MANGLQTIINMAETIQFDRRNVVGVQYTRSEIPKISETPTRNSWKMNVSIKASMPYNDYRALIERIDDLDRRAPDYITFSDNPKLSWLARYLGSCSQAQLNAMQVDSFIGNQLILKNLPALTPVTMTSTTPLFKSGDFIQIGTGTTNPYPFTVVNDVLRGSGSTVTLTMHRPNFITSSVANSNITVGNAVTFKMFCPNMPIYKLLPGATQYDSSGNIINNAYLEWSEDFKLYEWVGGA